MSTAEDLKLAALAGGSGGLVWYVDNDRLLVDEATERLFGVRRGSFGNTVADLLQLARHDSRDTITNALEQALAGATLVVVEFVLSLPDGGARHLELRATLVRNPERVVGAVSDVTQLAHARVELARTRETVSSRDAELRRNTASHANLASGISREIRTHLDAVLGMSRLLAESSLTPEQRDRVSTIHASGTELLSSVADLIDISTTDSELDLSGANIPALLAEATGAIARDTRVRTDTKIAPEVPGAVHVDATRLRRVIHHVLESALVLVPVDELAIGARSKRLGGTLHELTIDVRTSGGGISAMRIARLLDGTDSAGPIGIAIASKLVARMGGRLVLTSELAGGTTIAFTIPVDETRGATDAPTEHLDFALATKHPLRILVAEDNLTSRKITGAYLERLGYEPRFVGDGREAVETIKHERFDVVFMDVQMPVMDGLEAARALRRLEQHADVPRIIALTANALPRDRAACLAAGCDDYLTKPVSIETLHRALRNSPRIAPPLDPSAVDLSVLADLEKVLDARIVDELLATYDADGRELITALHAALVRLDANGLARAAHNLRSTSAALGARVLGETCGELENDTREGRLERAAELVEQATRQLTEVRMVLADHRKR